ncbi:MAG: cysteine--tRNA ligase [Pseudomonadota bacterium]|nr:cysteine--tRNA ligase [Pseudomonadota bacterium]MDE3038217.1 cysteine--tRNA ligase [Pseudomonadota bacterium]
MTLHLYNTLTRRKEEFKPIDKNNIRMYVCGPTVYDRPHLGNARSVVVYDVLYRLLIHLYGPEHVTYVRNVTDVDDKINAAAKANGEPISALTARVEGWFHEDMAALNCLPPTKEPHATQHIRQMIAMIEKLIAGGHAYESAGHVLFSVGSYREYGALSGRKLEDLIAGARVEVESYKKNPGDFVLWKPADSGDDPSSVFDSPWGRGRPGWHIECSAMSSEYLGENFDIHGGGADLMFPHHENEIAQSHCAAPKSQFANHWVHNGFLTVNGEKMSKSLGNFITVHDLLEKGVKGEVIRLALLSSKYNEPIDWNEKLVRDAKKQLDYFYGALAKTNITSNESEALTEEDKSSSWFRSLLDDLNTPSALSFMHTMASEIYKNADNQIFEQQYGKVLWRRGKIFGLLEQTPEQWFKGAGNDQLIEELINKRLVAKKAKNFAEADRIRKELADYGIILEDRPDGTTDWRGV